MEINDILNCESATIERAFSIEHNIYNFSRRLLLGNLILATIISPISYLIVKKIAKKIQNL